jgi:hypothetical protein
VYVPGVVLDDAERWYSSISFGMRIFVISLSVEYWRVCTCFSETQVAAIPIVACFDVENES